MLKILVIILLCLLGAALLLFLLALFYPVRYRLQAKGKNEAMQAKGRMWWLAGLLSMQLLWDKDKLTLKLCLCGIRLKEQIIADPIGQIRNIVQEDAEPKEAESSQEDAEPKEAESPQEDAEPKEAESSQEEENLPEAESGKNAAEVPEGQELPERVRAFAVKVKAAFGKASRVKRILGTRTGSRAAAFVKKQGLDLLELVKPRRLSGQIIYGLSDAASTAVLYGILAHYAYTMADGELTVIPDFTETGIDADVQAEGRMKAKPVLGILFPLFANEDVQRTYRAVKRAVGQ